MDPELRTPLLVAGLAFCLALAGLTIAAAAESRFSVLSAISLLIVGLVAVGLISAIRNPPDD